MFHQSQYAHKHLILISCTVKQLKQAAMLQISQTNACTQPGAMSPSVGRQSGYVTQSICLSICLLVSVVEIRLAGLSAHVSGLCV